MKTKKTVEKKKPGRPKTKPQALTPEGMAIFQRVRSEADDWKTITEESVDDYSLMQDPFKLPDEIKEFEKRREFKFRWIERTSSRLDEIRSASVPHKWWIVNIGSFPTLTHLCDPILGCISRLDQMLVFKPWWMWEKRMQLLDELNAAQDRSGTLEGKGKEARDGVVLVGGKKPADSIEPLPGEIKAGDKIEYEEVGQEDHGFGDLVTE